MARPVDAAAAHATGRGARALTRPRRRRPAAIFAWPALVAAATVAGLAAGLVGGDAWDWAAWAGLAVPVVAARARRT